MQRTNIYLEESQAAALEAIARSEGVSRAELVRRLIDRGISSAPSDAEADIAAIEESFGVCTDEPVPVRTSDARAAHLERVRLV